MKDNYNILKPKDYFNMFFEICQETKTYKEAWENIEGIFFEKYGISKYSTYESFRKAKSLYLLSK